ncbi:hypothetical protein FJTKL_03495 [Diaporthe vaccinii]|uniref:Uncharacterized protein n=1 Tax=Diaporthe vaccinii TaxID=105482 RepID=A0ABR4F2C2_9PEZI
MQWGAQKSTSSTPRRLPSPQPTTTNQLPTSKPACRSNSPLRPPLLVVIVASVATLRRSAGADQQQAAPLLPRLVALS